MASMIAFLQGKKTHIVVFLYILLTMFSGNGADASLLDGLNTENMQQALPALLVSTLKAAWDRKD